MRAITVEPGVADSVRLSEREPPQAQPGMLLVQTLALGVCGTDREIIAAEYGWAPEGARRLVLGHEVLGRVIEAPAGGGFAPGDLIAGVVRRPDPVPCRACAGGEWDMCLNGRYTEAGIKALDGYGVERFLLDPGFAVRLDPKLGELGVLVEPASVLAKAWDHIERIGGRTRTWKPRTVLVTGAGPIGLLAGLMARQRDLELHVLDRAAEGIKPELVRRLGGTYHVGGPAEAAAIPADVVLECTGADEVVMAVMQGEARNGVVCLAGVSSGGRKLCFDVGDFNRDTVLGNDVIFGTVNANLAHYEAGARALAAADPAWLSRLISRRVPLDRWSEAFERRDGDVKVVIDFALGTL